MLKHISLVNFKKDMTDSEKKIAAVKLKDGLENLNGKINGMEKLKVEIILLESSTADLLIDIRFKDKAALDGYKSNPLLFNVRNLFDTSVAEVHEASYIV